MTELSLEGVGVRASSVLQRNVKQYGPRLALEADPDTCWNSDQGSPQWLQLEFPAPVDVDSVVLTFQGGFVGQTCRADVICPAAATAGGAEASGSAAASAGASGGAGSADSPVSASSPSSTAWRTAAEFEPDDLNRAQTFACAASSVTKLRLVFTKSTDFYGRVIVYRVQLIGKPSAP